MVAVAHREQQWGGIGRELIFLRVCRRLNQSRKPREHAVHQCRLGNQPSLQVTAAEHEFKIVAERQPFFCLQHFSEDFELRVVIQDQDVRKLKRRSAADLHARGESVQNGAFSGPDKRLGALVVIISFQVQRDH